MASKLSAVKGLLLLPDGPRRGTLLLNGPEQGAILDETAKLPSDGEVLESDLIAPGFIDLQVNGAFGVEVEQPGALRHLATKLPSTGVTSYLPTVVTSPREVYRRVLAGFSKEQPTSGARPLGLHLEGPFLSPMRAGAHRRELIETADDGLLEELLASGLVKVMTLAPEREGSMERIRKLRRAGVVISLGHTDATFEEFVGAVDAGATLATHLFNAMSPMLHRAPGAVGGALAEERVTAGVIADGIHCHPACLAVAIRSKAPRLALVTDCMSAAGMGPGTWSLGGQSVIVDATSARLEDGTLAGSILTMDEAVRNAVRLGGASQDLALRMASETPARVLGLKRKGRLAQGCDADLVLLDSQLKVRATVIAGQVVYRR